MLTWDKAKEWCLEHLKSAEVTGDDKIHARCPICGDSKKSLSKKRLWVNEYGDGFAFYCYNCNESGSFYKLFSIVMGVSKDEARSKFESLDSARTRLTKKPSTPKIKEPEDPEYFDDILKDCVEENEEGVMAAQATKMLRAFRGVRKIPDWVKLYFAYKGDYRNRIIIPIFNSEGRITYFQARLLPVSSIGPKYKNPKAKKNIQFDLIGFRSPIILVEGLIDSFMLPKHGIPMLTAVVPEGLINRLSDYDIIIAFDNDKKGYEALRKFLEKDEHAAFVKYFLMPREFKELKDLNDIRIKFLDINIIEFVLQNSYSELKTKYFWSVDKWRN
jgi:hypothetical protein